MSSYQKVGTFRVVNGQKQGGNVASYFCTPDGKVLHVVAGPVTAEVLLREARWAVETLKMAHLECKESEARLKAFFRKVHSERLLHEHGYDIRVTARRSERPMLAGQGLVHRQLTLQPMVEIRLVYKYVFETILGEIVSTAPVNDGAR